MTGELLQCRVFELETNPATKPDTRCTEILKMEPEKQLFWTSSSTETFQGDLEEVCLNEDAKNIPLPLPPGRRPEVLKNVVHECLFVATIAFAAASSVFLQRSIVVIAAEIGNGLSLTPAEIAWVNSASG